jgi:hypothetical protein
VIRNRVNFNAVTIIHSLSWWRKSSACVCTLTRFSVYPREKACFRSNRPGKVGLHEIADITKDVYDCITSEMLEMHFCYPQPALSAKRSYRKQWTNQDGQRSWTARSSHLIESLRTATNRPLCLNLADRLVKRVTSPGPSTIVGKSSLTFIVENADVLAICHLRMINDHPLVSFSLQYLRLWRMLSAAVRSYNPGKWRCIQSQMW